MQSFSFFELNLKKQKVKDKGFNKKILNCRQKNTPKPFDLLDPNSPSHKYEKKKKMAQQKMQMQTKPR